MSSPAAGVRRYAYELVRELALRDDVDLIAIGGRHTDRLSVSHVRVRAWAPTNLGWSLAVLPLAIRRTRVAVFHAPAYTAPLVGVHPLVLTIHDVSYARHPEWYPYRRDVLRRAFYRRSARAADLIITDSEFSRGEIAAAYAIPSDRIVAIPLGVGLPFTAAKESAAATIRTTTPYVLHVGDVHPRRNVSVAVRAVLAIRERDPALGSLRLLLAGADRGGVHELTRLASNACAPEAVKHLGPIDEATLVALYHGAGALVYPSRYEGFGLPLVEAMACGTPVVAARAGAIPEVVGDAGPLVDPDNVDGFVEAISALLRSADVARDARHRSLARAARFSWARTADMTVAAYRRSLASAATP